VLSAEGPGDHNSGSDVLGPDAGRTPERRRWRTRIELANAIFEYLEIFHNRQRRHSSLGCAPPIEYERIHYDTPTVALPSQAS
jgi:hypothetical protein